MLLDEEKIELDVISEDVQQLNEATKVTKDALAARLGVEPGIIANMRGDTWNKIFKLALRQTMGKVENNDYDNDLAWAVIEWYWQEVCRKPLASIEEAKKSLRSLCAQNQQPLDNNPTFKVLVNLLGFDGSFVFDNTNCNIINDLFADAYFTLTDFRKQDLFPLKLLVNKSLYDGREYNEVAEIIKTYSTLAKKSDTLAKNAIIQTSEDANNMLTNIRNNNAKFEFDGSEAYVNANDKSVQLKNKGIDPINGVIRPLSDIRAILDAYEADQGVRDYERLFIIQVGGDVIKQKAALRDDKPPVYGASFANVKVAEGQSFKLFYKDETDNTNLLKQADSRGSIWEFVNHEGKVLVSTALNIDVTVDNSGDLLSLEAKKYEGDNKEPDKDNQENKKNQETADTKARNNTQADQANKSTDAESHETDSENAAMSKFEQALLAAYNNQKKQGHATTKLDALVHDGKVDAAKAKALEADIKEFDKALSTLEKADPDNYSAEAHDTKVAEYLVKKVYDNWRIPANQIQPTLVRFGIKQ